MEQQLKTIDLNCDMGEGMTTDEAIMPFISSANIACGYHAGNNDIMNRTVELCLQHHVSIGAHPGFNDKENFGRKDLIGSSVKVDDVVPLVLKQLEILQSICKAHGTSLHHVKPHGALYNRAAVDAHVSWEICKAIEQFDNKLLFYGLSGSRMEKVAAEFKLSFVSEVFADRTYQPDGTLTPRTQPNALIENKSESIRQALQMVEHNAVITVTGVTIPLKAETICLHGDGKNAVSFASGIHDALKHAHVTIKAPL